MESPSAIFEDVAEGGIGERAYKYRIKLDSGSGGTNSGTGNKIDIYVVNNDAYQTGGWYEDKLSYSSGIQYRSKKWTSDFWYCDEKKFDNSKTGYGLVICSNGGDGFFIDNMWLKKTCPTVGTWGCQTSETWSGNYCISTDSGDDFSGKCSQAYTCIHFRMNQSTVGPGTVRPTQQSSGSCSEKECQSTLGGQCGPWNPCCSGK